MASTEPTSLQVLVVEDRPADAELVIHELRRAGFDPQWRRVDTEADYRACLDPTLDLILADYHLPAFGALDALRLLGERGLDIPFIVVTGAIGEELAVEALRLGAADYLMKDRLTRLGQAVSRALEDRRLRNEQRQAEETLLRSEARFRGLFENVPVGVFQSTREGRYLAVNPALVEMLGYGSAEELLAADIARDVYVNPADREVLLRHLEERGAVHTTELSLRRKDGRPLAVLVNARAVRDERGGLLYYEGSNVDITERKRLEEQVRASQRMEAIGRLAGGIAHDFNNLLTVILGNCELALENLEPDHPLQGDLQEIRKAGESAASLTRQLLAFSRKQVLQPAVLDLNAVIVATERALRRLIGEDIAITTRPEPTLGRVLADAGQIEQILFNLAANARDAMPEGGRLTLETRNVHLDAPCLERRAHVAMQPGPYVMLAVSDTGHGMDEETQQHIFEPFFTTKPKEKGTGLGLSTVYGIVKQSGGYIGVYSEPGQGATFKVYLPRVETTGTPTGSPPPEPEVLTGSETILFVEDDAALRDLGARSLEQCGYTVRVAADGRTALGLWESHAGAIHLLVTDLVLPGMTGRALAEELRGAQPNLPVLYVSGYPAGAITDNRPLEADVAFLPKPFTPSSLARKVRQVLDAGKK